MKVQVKRLKTIKYPNPTSLDDKFVDANLYQVPEIGEVLRISNLHGRFNDNWITTIVKKVQFLKGYMDVYTRNSIYRFKIGWGRN